MKLLISLLCFFFDSFSQAQIKIDSSFPFQTDPDKKYSVYIPNHMIQLHRTD